jgi:hypothetical protein
MTWSSRLANRSYETIPIIHCNWHGDGAVVWDVPVPHWGWYRPSSLTSSGTLFRSSGQMSGYYSDKVIERSFPNNITNSGLREETSPRDFPTQTSQSFLALSLSKAHVRSTVKSYENRMWLHSFAHSYYFIFYSKSNVMTCSSDERSGRFG